MSEETIDYQPNQTDEYVNHLAEVKDTNPTTASEDIYNDQGVLLLSKGSVINKRVAGHLVQHQLKKELDQSIIVSNTLTVYDVLNQTLELIEGEPDLFLLHNHAEFEVTLRQLLFNKPIPSQILQRLTVMSRVMPMAYKRSLFCSWLVPLICKQMGHHYDTYFSAFSAGLAHDIGLMHIPVEAATATQDMTQQQWRALKTHPIVARMILESRNIYHDDMLNAVADHHERSDRSGYPAYKANQQVNVLAQILSMSDQLFKLYFDPERGQKSALEWIPYLEINLGTFGHASEFMLALLKKPAISDHFVVKEKAPIELATVTEENSQIAQLFDCIRDLDEIAGHYPRLKVARGVSETISQLNWVKDSAGLGSDHLSEWLAWSKDNPEDSSEAELSEIHDLLQGLRWRFRRLWRLAVELYWSDKLEAKHQAQVKKQFDAIGVLLPNLYFDLDGSKQAAASSDATKKDEAKAGSNEPPAEQAPTAEG